MRYAARLLTLTFLLWVVVGQAGTWVYTCEPENQQESQQGISGNYAGSCSGAANGEWVEVPDPEPWFNYPIDGESFRDLLLVTLMCLCAAWAVRTVSDVIRGKR